MDHHYKYSEVVTYTKAIRENIIKLIDELTQEEVFFTFNIIFY